MYIHLFAIILGLHIFTMKKMAYETCKFLNEKFGYNMPDMQTTFLKDSYN